MRTSTPFAAVVLTAAILSGCAAPAGDPPPNPLQDMIDLIPWAKSVADDASAADVTARIEEIRSALPNLAISDAARNEVKTELENLSAQIAANPDDVRAHVDQLRSIVAQLQAAVAAGP